LLCVDALVTAPLRQGKASATQAEASHASLALGAQVVRGCNSGDGASVQAEIRAAPELAAQSVRHVLQRHGATTAIEAAQHASERFGQAAPGFSAFDVQIGLHCSERELLAAVTITVTAITVALTALAAITIALAAVPLAAVTITVTTITVTITAVTALAALWTFGTLSAFGALSAFGTFCPLGALSA
jgi:hypothetical protein